MCFHRPPLKKLCQEDRHNLAENTSLKQHFPEALKIVRWEIGQWIRPVIDEDTGKKSWTLWRAPWASPGPSDEEVAESLKAKVNVNALSATAHLPHPPCIPLLHLDATVGLPREGHEKGQQLRGVCGFPHFRCGAGALPDPRLPARRSTVG